MKHIVGKREKLKLLKPNGSFIPLILFSSTLYVTFHGKIGTTYGRNPHCIVPIFPWNVTYLLLCNPVLGCRGVNISQSKYK